jgi:type III restriction enzyme
MLYEDFSKLENLALGDGKFIALCDEKPWISKNLSPSISLRDYQKDAIGRFEFYWNGYLAKENPKHLLFNMATGSGKTVVMAALILDLYSKGYRNFLFFTRLGNIVEKTKLNLVLDTATKYLFKDVIKFNGTPIAVKEVKTFTGASESDINILFSTTGNLHDKLHNPSENSLTFEDFKRFKVCLIADEAHNLTADTRKKKTAQEIELSSSWENTVLRILNSNREENVLLEYTATSRLDASNPELLAKYENKAICKYDLKQFRSDGYSKDVMTIEVDSSILERSLIAVTVSQYKLKVAQKYGIKIKPVVLFKANRVSKPKNFNELNPLGDETLIVSSVFQREFLQFLAKLRGSDLEKLREVQNPLLLKAFTFFDENGISLESLADEIKLDFSLENVLSVDDTATLDQSQALLNTLEDEDNHIRAVFATQKLNEGWDVLNLFDIVRLYNTRDAAKNVAGATTVEEAQLIGRGARYYPFHWDHNSSDYKRKFDSDTLHELRIIEELHYHSKTNSRYIQELRSVLTDLGIIAEKSVDRIVRVKTEIEALKLWQEGLIFVNKRIPAPVELSSVTSTRHRDNLLKKLNQSSFSLPSRTMRRTVMFGVSEMDSETGDFSSKTIKVSELGDHILRHVIWSDARLSFSNLKMIFPSANDMSDLISNPLYLGSLEVTVNATNQQLASLSQIEKHLIASFVIHTSLLTSLETDKKYVGSEVFYPISLRDVFGDEKTLKLDANSERSKPMDDIDLENANWFAQNEIWGTSEEKNLVRFIKGALIELGEKFEDLLLIRNEMHFPIYAFADGAAFYPDFVLIGTTKNSNKKLHYQVFIEPKGDQFLDSTGDFKNGKEGWKQDFLDEILIRSDLLLEDVNYRLIGLPFFNSGNFSPKLREKFSDAFESNLLS